MTLQLTVSARQLGKVTFRYVTGAMVFLAALIGCAVPGPAVANGTEAQACNAGDVASCLALGKRYADPAGPEHDTFLAVGFLQRACRARQAEACGRLALIYFDGDAEIPRNLATAGRFAFDACAGFDSIGCEVAEAVFADPSGDQFDAEKALRYRRVNCDAGRISSCEALARIYYNLEDFAPAEQLAHRVCASGSVDRSAICAFAADLEQRRRATEQALARQINARNARLAQRERASAVVTSFLQQRQYDSAIYAAIYHSRSAPDAQRALEATLRAGALGGVFKDHLYVLDYWFPTGPLNRAVNAEIARRSNGNSCGIYNCTNRPGASSQRWLAAGGGSGAKRSYGSGSSTSASPRVKSAAEITRETRNRYRTAHCTMNNNANRTLCS